VFESFGEARRVAQQEFFDLLCRQSIRAGKARPWAESEEPDKGATHHSDWSDVNLHTDHQQTSAQGSPSAARIAADYPASPTEAASRGAHDNRQNTRRGAESSRFALQQPAERAAWTAFPTGDSCTPCVWIEEFPGPHAGGCRALSIAKTAICWEEDARRNAHNSKDDRVDASCNPPNQPDQEIPCSLFHMIRRALRCILDPNAGTDDE
jgi:hypothetical protein